MKKPDKTTVIRFAALLTAAALFAFGYQCPFRLLFGISCPCCGLRTALFAAARLDPAAAFAAHPLWWLFALYFVYLAVSLFMQKKRNVNAPDLAVTLSVLSAASAVWLVRLFL